MSRKLSRGNGVRVSVSQGLRADTQRALRQSLCLDQIPLLLPQEGEIKEDVRRFGVMLPQLPLSDGKGTLIERLGLLILSLSRVDLCQSIEGMGYVGMRLSQGLLPNVQGTLVERFCLLVLALLEGELRQIVERKSEMRILSSQLLLALQRSLIEAFGLGLLPSFEGQIAPSIEHQRCVHRFCFLGLVEE